MANLAGTGPTIPTNFIGLSGEVGDFTNGYYQGTTGSAASFINLVKLLGSNGVLRLGGLSSDVVALATVNATQANNLASFVAGIGAGWTVIYGLCGFNCNDTTKASTQAGFLATALGVNNVVFQYANEPIDDLAHTVGQFQTLWNSYDAAVKAAVSGAKSAAWDDGNWTQTQTAINGLTGGAAAMNQITNHYYGFCRNTFSFANPSALLSAPYSFQSGFTQNITYAASAGVKIRITETNSLCGSGQTGMSDRMMAATWVLNLASLTAYYGFAGINLHNHYGWFNTPQSAAGIYNYAVQNANQNFTAGTVFYGMFMFSKIVGQQIIPASVSGNSNIAAIATKGGGGNANIIVVNNDVVNRATVNVDQSSAWTTATLLQIKGNAGCYEASPTIGGAAIGESGAWSGGTTSIAKGTPISLGPCEAALIQIQP